MPLAIEIQKPTTDQRPSDIKGYGTTTEFQNTCNLFSRTVSGKVFCISIGSVSPTLLLL